MPIRQPAMSNIFVSLVYHELNKFPAISIVYAGESLKLAYDACLNNKLSSYSYLEAQHWCNGQHIHSFDVEKVPYVDFLGNNYAPAPVTLPKEEIERLIEEAVKEEDYIKAAQLKKQL